MRGLSTPSFFKEASASKRYVRNEHLAFRVFQPGFGK